MIQKGTVHRARNNDGEWGLNNQGACEWGDNGGKGIKENNGGLLFLTEHHRVVFTEIYCRPLEDPVRGSISPSSCTQRFSNIRRATVCRFNCTAGFEIRSNQAQDSLTCMIDGTWDHSSPSCHREYIQFQCCAPLSHPPCISFPIIIHCFSNLKISYTDQLMFSG